MLGVQAVLSLVDSIFQEKKFQMSSLDRLFQPKSIAVVGASNNEDKVGYHLVYALKKFPGKIYPVNPKEQQVQERKA
jgi:acyl-CoA synthetase (NDP forming)